MEDHIVAAPSIEDASEVASLSAIVYRSVADRRLSAERLGEMLAAARARNARENITGLLLFDGTHFVQWFEGPEGAIERIWASIRSDDRHRDVELLGRPRLPVRLFRGWEMGLAGRSRTIAEGIDDVVLVDDDFFGQLEDAEGALGTLLDLLARVAPADSVLSTAEDADARTEHVRVLCLDHVLPIVQARFGLQVHVPVPRRPVGASLPRIDPAFVERFADHLRAAEQGAVDRVWSRLVGLGCSPSSLCSDLVEPAARRLGDLWADDACSGADLTIAEAELLMLLRRGAPPAAPRARLGQPRVAVLSPPGSRSVLGPAMVAMRLEALHCCTECLLPESDDELDAWLTRLDFPNLVIALDPMHGSSADEARLDRTVLSARSAMVDRDLRVMLYGRQVSENPGIHQRTHADSAYATLAELDDSLLD